MSAYRTRVVSVFQRVARVGEEQEPEGTDVQEALPQHSEEESK